MAKTHHTFCVKVLTTHRTRILSRTENIALLYKAGLQKVLKGQEEEESQEELEEVLEESVSRLRRLKERLFLLMPSDILEVKGGLESWQKGCAST